MMKRIRMSLREALEDPDYLGRAIPGESWSRWRPVLIAIAGEPLLEDEIAAFEALTGRKYQPGIRPDEFWAVIGRRGGKTRAMACLAVYLATLIDYSAVLASGERGVIPFLASATDQAKRAFNHAEGILNDSPVLSRLVASSVDGIIELSTGVDLEIKAANYRTIRGLTAVAAVCDEIAFWMVDNSVNPDTMILEALRPALATTGGQLIVISSPYGKKGVLWETYKQEYGEKGDPHILVIQAESRTMNPSLSQSFVEKQLKRNPQAGKSEYLGQFRDDKGSFILHDVVDAAIDEGIFERKPAPRVNYFAFVDPSGGSSDSMTMAIAHWDEAYAVLDFVMEVEAPFVPTSVVRIFAEQLKRYGLYECTGDRYASEWVVSAFANHGITYTQSKLNRSEIYLTLLPSLNSGQVRLITHEKLKTQLLGLERKIGQGADIVDHAKGSHDDVINAAAGALVMAAADGSEGEAGIMLIAFGAGPTQVVGDRPEQPRQAPLRNNGEPDIANMSADEVYAYFANLYGWPSATMRN